ncbi:beta-fructofuranosidase [Entomoplasma freundtii]|uniref:beta-fructofuranosidase n=1 Tax=Entomoplasma freundtii TaxID=74700 RepID=A0A2K8NQT4_9MOLU|nr:GH32 C-terminal domain-containing protein [Entomoplasma freundtii]ATZ16179.1 sucrose-6-phosphate hydrolase [Entomoplasma freundtii]TDY56920.1 beta-fructofuranosidase [Entomoplasma freundtii]
MKEQHDWITRGDLSLFYKLHQEDKGNWYTNKFHLTSYAGALYDPNGLIYYKGWYYIFFQNCPFSDERLIPSWGLYMTTDFIHYDYQGLTITPSCQYDKDGAYSGHAFIEAGQLYFYYSGLVQLQEELETTFVMKAQLNLKKQTTRKTMLFGQDLSVYSGYFHDPMIFEKNGGHYMLNGAQSKHKKGLISLYGAEDRKLMVWHSVHPLEWPNLSHLEPLRVEAPGYIKDNGNDNEYLYFSTVAKTKGLEGRKTWYQKGKFNKIMEFESHGPLKLFDKGLDFYAPQFFQNCPNQNITLGWLGNPASKISKTLPNNWLSQLSLPREVTWVNGVMYQQPANQLKKLRVKTLSWGKKITYPNGLIEIKVDQIEKDDFFLKIHNSKHEALQVTYQKGLLEINRTDMTLKDAFNLPPLQKIAIDKINNLRLLVDRSCLEIFINDGEHSVSVLFYVLNHTTIETDLTGGEAYQLKGFSLQEENTLFLNSLNH